MAENQSWKCFYFNYKYWNRLEQTTNIAKISTLICCVWFLFVHIFCFFAWFLTPFFITFPNIATNSSAFLALFQFTQSTALAHTEGHRRGFHFPLPGKVSFSLSAIQKDSRGAKWRGNPETRRLKGSELLHVLHKNSISGQNFMHKTLYISNLYISFLPSLTKLVANFPNNKDC